VASRHGGAEFRAGFHGGKVAVHRPRVRGYAISYAMKLRRRPGRRHRPGTGLAAGPLELPAISQRVDMADNAIETFSLVGAGF